jgi:hypothetical protein
MPASPVSDDGQIGPGRPLTDHEQRRLDDISAWLDLTDAGFGARMRCFSPRPSRSAGRRSVPATRSSGSRAEAGEALGAPGSPGAPFDDRSWNRLVRAAAGVTFVLILLIVFAADPWAVLAVSLLVTVVPMMLIAIYALRLPDTTDRSGRDDSEGPRTPPDE